MKVENDNERATLREAGKKHAVILQQLAVMVVPGISTAELEDEARRLITEAGAESAFLGYQPQGAKRPYPAALCVSVNDAIVHGIPNENSLTIQEGDIVTLDCGILYQKLITDAAVCVIAGHGSYEDKTLIRAAKEALDAGIAQARTGNHIGDIGAAIEAIGKKYDLGSPRELGGHSVGRHVHEEPFVPNFGPAGSGEELVDGMVLAIEPMFMLGGSKIYLDPDGYTYRTRDGSKSAHVEHTVIVGKDRAEVLTQYIERSPSR
ncbi:type I methionyl aminopeptidase [Candidatus Kaiserbacteria bacterium]|nr:type I methionyl aminopeptidase [Candidatus Kaiserbacteria bacterium]